MKNGFLSTHHSSIHPSIYLSIHPSILHGAFMGSAGSLWLGSMGYYLASGMNDFWWKSLIQFILLNPDPNLVWANSGFSAFADQITNTKSVPVVSLPSYLKHPAPWLLLEFCSKEVERVEKILKLAKSCLQCLLLLEDDLLKLGVLKNFEFFGGIVKFHRTWQNKKKKKMMMKGHIILCVGEKKLIMVVSFFLSFFLSDRSSHKRRRRRRRWWR